MSESILGYTVVNSAYTAGIAGAIVGDRTALPGTFTAEEQITTDLNGDPTIYNFLDANAASRVVIGEYDYSQLKSLKFRNPTTLPWSTVTQSDKSWSAIKNLYSVATIGRWLYALDYDLGNIAAVNMLLNSYTQSTSYNFPTYFNAIEEAAGYDPIVPDGKQNNGVAVAIVGNYLYALFTTVDNPWGAANYEQSTVVRMSINTSTGVLTYTAGDYVKVGKNASALEYFDNKFYVCCIGGKQLENNYNTDSCIYTVNLGSTMSAGAVKTAPPGDFRDISILDNNNVYLLVGYYTTNYLTFSGSVYKTTITQLAAGNIGTAVINFNDEGYFWAIHCEDVPAGGTDRFWMMRGKPIDIYAPLPASTSDTPAKSFAPADLGSGTVNANLNSATLIQPSQTAGARIAKSFGPHAVLAAQARQSAVKLSEAREALDEASASSEK